MIIRPSEPEVKIAVDRDPVKTSFEEWARPGHFLPLFREPFRSSIHMCSDRQFILDILNPVAVN